MSEQTHHHHHQLLLLLLDLFDSFWSEFPIFSTKPPPSSSLFPPPLETTLHAKVELVPEASRPSEFRSSLHARSMSETDVMMASADTAWPLSPPYSVLSSTPKLETVHSGKEPADFFGDGGSSSANAGEAIERPGSRERTTRRRKKRTGIARTISRSLSELEFEELKGFMDLGFVFSEQDRDSALVSIIPGLQRLGIGGGDGDGIERNGEGGGEVRTEGVSRPYLSEAWGVFERQRKAPPMSWRIPEIGSDETAMKDQLRFWAQAVASAVR